MRTQKALSLLVLGIFIFSMLGPVVFAQSEDEPFYVQLMGDKEDTPGKLPTQNILPQGADLGDVAKAIAWFGGLCGDDGCSDAEGDMWYYVPITMIVVILLIYLLLRKSVFKKITGGAGPVEEVVSAVIAICFGSLAVYGTGLALWVVQIGFWAVIAALIILGLMLAYGGYTGGRGIAGDIRTEHLQGLSGRRRANAIAKKAMAEIRRKDYLTKVDEDVIKEMETTEEELLAEDRSIIRVAERLRLQFERAVQVWKQQPTMLGSAPKARLEIKNILPSVKWLKNVLNNILRQRELKAASMMFRIENITKSEEKLLKKLAKEGSQIAVIAKGDLLIDKDLIRKDKRKQKMIDKYSKTMDVTGLNEDKIILRIIKEARVNTNKARVLVKDVEKIQKDEAARLNTLDPILTSIVNQLRKIWIDTSRYGGGISHLEEGLRRASLFEQKVKALYIDEEKEEQILNEILKVEELTKGLDNRALNALMKLSGVEAKAVKAAAPGPTHG